MIERLDVLIMTWNSMPEIRHCLDSLKKAFPNDVVHQTIVVDKNSTDGTVDVAREYGCKVVTDDGTLGSARMTGLHASNQKWICWVDSDIVLPEDWFIDMRSSLYTHFMVNSKSIGWIFGRTIDDFEPLRSEKLYKMQLELGSGFRILKSDDRPYTHNSICLREPLLKADIKHLNSWEDYVLGQAMMEAGYCILEFPVACTHLRKSTYNKWGDLTEAWSISGELKTRGFSLRVLLKPFWFLYWGLRCSFHFHSFSHFSYNVHVFSSQIHALMNPRRFFTWDRK